MVIDVLGFKVVGGKRKTDGSDWKAVNLYYSYTPEDTSLVGSMTASEFINVKFLDTLRSSGLGSYQIDFNRGYDGKAYVSGMEKL